MVKGIIIAPCSATLIYVVLGFFVSDARIQYGVAAAVLLMLLYLAVFSENIRFELEPDGTFRYFQKGKLRNSFRLEDCLVGYSRKSEGTSHDILLQVVCLENGQEETIDCSPIGLRRFEKMFQEIKGHTKEEAEVSAGV